MTLRDTGPNSTPPDVPAPSTGGDTSADAATLRMYGDVNNTRAQQRGPRQADNNGVIDKYDGKGHLIERDYTQTGAIEKFDPKHGERLSITYANGETVKFDYKHHWYQPGKYALKSYE